MSQRGTADPMAREQDQVLDRIAMTTSEIEAQRGQLVRLISTARTEKNCTLAQIAEAAGVSRERIRQILDGLNGGRGR